MSDLASMQPNQDRPVHGGIGPAPEESWLSIPLPAFSRLKPPLPQDLPPPPLLPSCGGGMGQIGEAEFAI